jgi:hypothetical protein
MTKHVTVAQLQEEINKVVSCQPVSVDICTEPKMRKTGNPYMGVKKEVTINGLMGFNYGNSVNNQLGREDKEMNFTPEARKWGELRGNLVFHKDKVYLQVKAQSSSTPVYTLNEEIIEKAILDPFLVVSTKPHTQEDVDKEIVVRDITLENIRAMRMLGNEYVIVLFADNEEKVKVATEKVTENA